MAAGGHRTWSEDEYIITLDSYFRNKHSPRHVAASFVLELARLLDRTAASIVMRMENFASVDPEESAARRGLTRISPLGRKIFADWQGRPDHLRSCAEVSRRRVTENRNLNLFAPDLLGPDFDDYEVLDQIGDGYFGRVFSCVHKEAGLPFAIKRIKTEQLYDQECMGRFAREMRILRSIEHPNVIRVHKDNLDTNSGRPAFVMDLAEISLREYMEEEYTRVRSHPSVPFTDAVRIIESVLAAVQALHGNAPAIIHRDVNPNNILRLPTGVWVLADFSLAKFLKSKTPATFTTKLSRGLGTAFYAAPEQFDHFKKANESADIYAVGVLIWELFTTSDPPPVPGDEMNCGLLSPLARVYARATRRNSVERYVSVPELRKDFIEAIALHAQNVEGVHSEFPS